MIKKDFDYVIFYGENSLFRLVYFCVDVRGDIIGVIDRIIDNKFVKMGFVNKKRKEKEGKA